MASFNEVTLIGNCADGAELRESNGGTKWTRLRLATSRFGKNEGTDWHNVVAFGKTAELISTGCEKGSRVFVKGRIQYTSKVDPDGGKKIFTDIIANTVQFLDREDVEKLKGSDFDNGSATHRGTDDDLPF